VRDSKLIDIRIRVVIEGGIDGRGRAQFNGDDVVYVFPSRFLRDNYNLVYTDGSSEVFHR